MPEMDNRIPQMRTIEQVAAWLRECDPGTAITKTAIRRLVTTGAVPSVRIGTKYLVDLGALIKYLDTGAAQK